MIATWKKVMLTLASVPAILLLWLLADGWRPYLGAQPLVQVDIPRGMRAAEIAQLLEKAGAIRSRWTFLGLHALTASDTLKAGEYDFQAPASTWQVLRKIVRGDVSYQVLTITEGENRFEIADAVAEQGFSTREEFLAATEDGSLVGDLDPLAPNLEGYLFPDSYHFPRHARPTQIVRSMVNRFRQVLRSFGPLPVERSLREIVTVASLVEKETGLASERALIAGIFYNRLRRGIALQADPTVVYAALLDNRSIGRIRKSDLAFESPYNTYVTRGLPPGAISNPGRAALRAAMKPATTDYLFFVAKADGGHVFSRTLAEHNLAVQQYRQDLRAQLQQNGAAEPEPQMNAAQSP
jgi:UPF0755 protein